MAGATNESATTEVGLVLQGGGALGAYEWGAILALLDFIDGQRAQRKSMVLEVVTGVSIGAINAACVVGASGRIVFPKSSREHREQARRLRAEGVLVKDGRVTRFSVMRFER